ncbi:hypothetical protein FRB90_010032 [Tulasnella sp. 427]|nr:hypothetical protein FRB90_010032 [Tulasnella sp. 427]
MNMLSDEIQQRIGSQVARMQDTVEKMVELLASSQNPEERPPHMDQHFRQFVDELRRNSDVCNRNMEEMAKAAVNNLDLTLELCIHIASTRGDEAHTNAVTNLQKSIADLIKLETPEKRRNQYAEEMRKHATQADARFEDATKGLPNGGGLLGMQLGLRLANSATQGLPVIFEREVALKRIATVTLSEAILKASSDEVLKKGETVQLGNLKQKNQAQLEGLNDPVLTNADHIADILLIFHKVLISGSGEKPDWGDIMQDKSNWAYVKKGLEDLGKAQYESSALGKEGKAIVQKAAKLVDEIRVYGSNQTASRVVGIVAEVRELKAQAGKLAAATSLRRCQAAFPLAETRENDFPELRNDSVAMLAVQNWAYQLATIGEQLEGARALYRVTVDDRLATLDQSKRFVESLRPLSDSEGSPKWDSLHSMLLGLIRAITQRIIEIRYLQTLSTVMAASIDVISTACEAYCKSVDAPSSAKLGRIALQDYKSKTILNHLRNFLAVASTLNRVSRIYVNAYSDYLAMGQRLMQRTPFGDERARDLNEDHCKDLLEWTSSTRERLNELIEERRTEFEKGVDQRLFDLRRSFPFSGDDLAYASIKKAREEHVAELTVALQSAARRI